MRIHIALDRILHDVEPDQRKEGRAADRHQRADPRRVVHATVAIADHDPDFLSGYRISQIQCRGQRDQKAVTAGALEEISANHLIEDSRRAHTSAAFSTGAALCSDRQNKYASSRLGVTGWVP